MIINYFGFCSLYLYVLMIDFLFVLLGSHTSDTVNWLSNLLFYVDFYGKFMSTMVFQLTENSKLVFRRWNRLKIENWNFFSHCIGIERIWSFNIEINHRLYVDKKMNFIHSNSTSINHSRSKRFTSVRLLHVSVIWKFGKIHNFKVSLVVYTQLVLRRILWWTFIIFYNVI